MQSKNYNVDPDSNSLWKNIQLLKDDSLNYDEFILRFKTCIEVKEQLIHAFVDSVPDIIGKLNEGYKRFAANYKASSESLRLYGIPIGIKDIFHVDGFKTKAGSKLPSEVLCGEEGSVVKKLKAAGAFVPAKTVTTEFAYFAAGPTRNPNNLAFSPGGSSSGSAAAVAAGMVPVALGTQTIGSIIRPAAFCGVIGFKPSQGRVSTDGVVPLSPSLDQIGFFTTDIESSKLISSIIIDHWKDSRASMRFCIPEGNYLRKMNEDVKVHFLETIKKISSCIEIIKIKFLDDIDDIIEKHYKLLSAEAARVHSKWFDKYKYLYNTKTIELIESGKNISEGKIKKLREYRKIFQDEIQNFLEKNNIDGFITPSTAELPSMNLNYTGNPVMSLPWTFAGLPAVNIPVIRNEHNIPIGIQIIGKFLEDEKLLQVAKLLENCVKT